MKTRLASAFSRCRTFLRRWLRWTWLSRLPLDGPRPWWRNALRPRRSAGELWSSFHPSLEILEVRFLLSTFEVTNTNDSGPNSLRAAIVSSNAAQGPSVIDFSIGSGAQTINLQSSLPAITKPVTIDGTSQPGFAGTPLIVLNGTSAGSAYGLVIYAGNSTVEGLVIEKFSNCGIYLATNGGDDIAGNYIGTDSTGETAAANSYGILIECSNNTVGGMTAAARNVISGNTNNGVEFYGSTATGNVLEGNYIGTDKSGTAALGNGTGVDVVLDASNNTIGGTAAGAGNVISGNTVYGVETYEADGNVLEGNYIGTDKSGTAALGNVNRGVAIESSNNTIGGTVAGAGNVICANPVGGVAIFDGSGNVLEGNYIGTDKSGTVNLGNANYGVYVDVASNTIGGTAAGAGNVIANNSGDGVLVATATGNAIRGNSIYNSSKLGIQLYANGNNNQPAPVLTSASTNGSQISIAGTLTAAASTSYSLDFFSSPSANSSGYGEGKQYLGSATVTTNSSGTVGFAVAFNVAVPVGQVISATATDPSGNTSAFAKDVTATYLPDPSPATVSQLQSDFSYANANSTVAVVIVLQAGTAYSLSAIGTQLLDQSTAGITLGGNGDTISAVASNNRIFQVDPGDKLSLKSLTVTGGTVSAATAQGGGIADSGGALTLSDVKITKNKAEGSLGIGQGGGIYVKGGSLTLMNGCTIASNQATGGSGGPYRTGSITAQGGGVYVSGGVVNITSSSISDNVAKGKAGVGTFQSKSLFGTSTLGKAGGGAQGGGLYVNGTSWTVKMAESTVASNSAVGGAGAPTGRTSRTGNGTGGSASGGGIYVSGGSISNVFQLLSTSLSHNEAQGGSDGGIGEPPFVPGGGLAEGGGMYFGASASLTIQASGFEANTVTGGGGVVAGTAFGGGLDVSSSGSNPLTIKGSSFDANRALGGNGSGGTRGTITSSPFANQGGACYGGGLYLNTGSVTITNSSVTNNVAQGGNAYGLGGYATGGGIASGPFTNSLTLINTTLGTNKAQGGNNTSARGAGPGYVDGGGLYVGSPSTLITLINDTIAFNNALGGNGGSGTASGGGVFGTSSDPLTLTNVILEGNSAGTTTGPDVSGSVSTSSGYDFISNTVGISNASSLNSLPHMILGVTTSQLGTLTIDSATGLSYYPPLFNSTIRNAGTTSVVATIAAAEGVTLSAATDEIGDSRTISNQIDMGAIEEGVIPSATSATLNPLTATQGMAYSGTVLTSLSDPDNNVLYSETINWGDGTISPSQSIGSATSPLPTFSHVYGLGGDYEVTDTLVANRGGTSTTIVLTTTATVTPEMTVQADNLTASSCQTMTSVAVGTFVVPAGGSQSGYTATIDWGDGAGAQSATLQSTGSGSFNVVATHAYHLGGTFLTDVRVTDLSGDVVDAYGTVTVTPTTPAPDPALTVFDIHANQGVVSSGTVATFTTLDTVLASGAFAALIAWGDGTQSAGTISGSAGAFTVSAAHTYTVMGLHEVQVAVTGPTGSGLGGASAEVTEATAFSLTSQSLTLTSNVSVANVLLATATGLPAGAYSAKVDWGDGSTGSTVALVTGSAATQWLANSQSHSYANPGNYLARVRLYDANGNLLKTAFDPVTVTNLEAGTAGGDNFAWFQVMPPSLDQSTLWSATINWGDGSTASTVPMVGDGEYFSLSQGQHNYAVEGTYTQQVTFATSVGTSVASISRTVVVADAPLTNASPPPSPLQVTQGTTFTAVPVAAFNDADPNAVLGNFSATIDWGDGTTSTGTVIKPGSVFEVEGTHVYAAGVDAAPAVYTVSVLIEDQGGASLVSTLLATVSPVVTLSDETRGDDPSRALLLPSSELTIDLNQGAVRISEPLDFDASPGTTIGGDPALVYNSATADGQAILQLSMTSSVAPQSATFTVTWEGTTLASIPWTPSGQTGPVYVIDLPISSTVAASGEYNWTVQANVVYAGGSTAADTLNGQTSVVVNTASPDGAGWGLQSTSRLVFTPTGNVLMVYGDGDSRLFASNGNGTFTSPAEDFGTLSGGLCQGYYLYTAPHDVQYSYDLNGHLTEIVQPNGWTTSYTLNSSGLLAKVTTPDSGVTTLNYNSNELLTTIVEPGTRTVAITYGTFTAGGYNLASISDPTGNFVRNLAYSPVGAHLLASDNSNWSSLIYYSYVGNSNAALLSELVEGGAFPGTATYTITPALSAVLLNANGLPLAQMIDGVGNTTTYLLDSRGHEEMETQPDGSSATWQNDLAGDATHYTDFNGLSTSYTYDGHGNLTKEIYPNNTTQSYAYNATFNEVTQAIDPVGNTTSYQYDAEGELTLQTIGYGSPQAATSSYTWSGGLMQSMTDPDGNKTSYTYTGFLLTSQTLYIASGTAVSSQNYTYDSAGNSATTVDSDKGTTQYFYDGDNNLLETIDPDGITTSQAYTAYGTPYLTIDGRGVSTYYYYDLIGLVYSQVNANNTPQAQTTSYDYNGAGQLTMTVDPAGHSTSYAYDSNGDQTLVVQALGTPQQNSIVSKYDHDGNLTQSIDADHNTTSYQYDAVGNETLMIQGYGTGAASTTSMTYDGDGNLLLQTIGVGTPDAEATSYAYDSNGNQTLQITGYGSSKPETTGSFYDGDGNLTKQVDGVGNTSTFLYDALGDQTQSVVGTATTKDSYDGNGNLTLSVDAAGHTTSYLYDADGNETQMIQGYGTASASTTSMAYDADGNETLAVQGKGTTAVESSFYAYDLNGNQTEVVTGYQSSKPESTSSFYDGDNNLTEQIDGNKNTSTYLYDALGDQTQSVVGNATTKDSYDGDGNLTLSVDAAGHSTSYQYDADGNETLMIQGFNSNVASSTTYGYDAAGNETLLVVGLGTTAAASSFYAYDANGNQTQVITGYNSGKPETTAMAYDADNNLTQQIDGNKNTSTFAYDALGDQTQSVVGNATTKDSYDGDGNLTLSVDGAGHSTSYQYDADGNETLMIQGVGISAVSSTSYAYDADGNQTLVVTGLNGSDPESTSYAYDADGNQTLQITGFQSSKPESTSSFYDGDNNLTEQIDGNKNTSTYLYDALGDQTQSVVGNATTKDSYDGDGNLTLSVDAVGHSTSYQYDADGNETMMIQGYGTAAVSSTSYAYDADGNQTLVVTGLNGSDPESISYAYDADGNQTLQITGYGSTKPETTSSFYDGDNNLTQQVDGVGNTSSFAYDALGDQTQSVIGTATTKDSYDGDGNLTLSVDAVGHSTSYQYDADGNETLMIQGLNSNAVSSTTYGYDATGNQTLEVTGLSGSDPESTSYGYDANGNQTLQITGYNSTKSETTSSFYDADNNLTQQVDGVGNTSSFAYDALGDQTQSVIGTATTKDSYDGDGNLTLSVDAAGHSTSYQYDADGNETLMIQGYGTSAVSSTSYAYDADGNQTLVVTGLGTSAAESTSYAYDANGNQTLQITGYNSSKPETTVMAYDADNNLTQQVDGDLHTSTFAYDALGDQTQSVVGNATSSSFYDGDGNLTLSVDAVHDSTSYQYDADGNETLMIQGYGTSAVSSTSYGYDASGNQTLAITGLNGSDPESTSYAYDADGNQTLQITGYGSAKTESTSSFYDADNNLTEQIDGNKNTSTFAYDALGDQTQSVVGNATTSNSYDGDGELTLSVDAATHTTSYQYDADGNETLMIQGFNSNAVSSTSYGYDASGNQTLVVTGLNGSDTESTSYGYDANSNQTLQITGYGGPKPESTSSFYDGDNNLTQQIDGAGHTSDFAYDALGDQTQSVVGLGSSNPNPGTTSSFYDGDGNLTLTVNPVVGDSTSYQYDADGNQTLEIDGYNSTSAATIHYLYDASGNLTQEIDPVGNTTSFQYDADGEQTLMIQAYGTTSAVSYSYKYDNDGNVTLQTNPNGTSISSSYDLDGHLTQQLWYNNGGTLNNSLSYTYDGDGNILTASNDAGSYHFAYNADGEQTQVVTPSGVTLNYLYDASGNTTQVTDSLGDTVASQYDANGNLLQRTDTAFGVEAGVSFAYDGDGNITAAVRLALVGGVLQPLGSSTYSYDAQGDTTSIVYKNASGGTNDSFGYAYNAAGQVTQEVDYNGTTTNYAYDATGQLTSAGAAAYSYDANGNPNKTGVDTVGANNEVTSDGTWTYGYDANGNMTSKVGVTGGVDAGLTWSFSYDPGNELTSAIEKNSSGTTLVSATYSYDVFGQRIQSSISTGGSTVVTNYVYNGSTVWATLTSADALQTLYIAGDRADQYFGQMNASSGGSYRTDRLGTVRDLVSTTGTVLDAIVYDAFGNVVSQTTASLAPLIGYAGYQYDSSLGGDFTRSRIYLPSLGRFFTEDPTGLIPDSNLYRYVRNDPTNATDPTGHELLADGRPREEAKQSAENMQNWLVKELSIQSSIAKLPTGRWVIVPQSYSQVSKALKDWQGRPKSPYNDEVIRALRSLVSTSYHAQVLWASGAFDTNKVFFSYGPSLEEKVAINELTQHEWYPHAAAELKARPLLQAANAAQVQATVDRIGRAEDESATQAAYIQPANWSDSLLSVFKNEKVQQSLRVAGGAASVIGGIVLLTTPGGQVFGVILIGSGLDDLQASIRSLAEGSHVDSIRHDVAASLAARAGLGTTGQQVVGLVADIGVPTAASAGPSAVRLAGKLGKVARLGKASRVAIGAEGTIVENAGQDASTLGKVLNAKNAEVESVVVEAEGAAGTTPARTSSTTENATANAGKTGGIAATESVSNPIKTLTETELLRLKERLVAGEKIVLNPKTTYRIGEATYTTDEVGRIAEARFTIEKGTLTTGRTATATDTAPIGKLADAESGDIGFHLMGDQFGGSQYYPNLVPGNGKPLTTPTGVLKNLNQGAYATLEGLWKDAALAGKRVDVNVSLVYNSTASTTRADIFRINFRISGRPFTLDLYNKAGESISEALKRSIRAAINSQ